MSRRGGQKRKKMDVGNIEACLRKALHHLERGPTVDKTWLMMQVADDPVAVIEYRHRILFEEIQEVLKRIQGIRRVATQPEVLAILEERFEFGHDLDED